MTREAISIQHHKETTRAKKDKFQEALMYLYLGGTLYLDGQYIVYQDGDIYHIGLVHYDKKFWHDTLGKAHCDWLPVVVWSEVTNTKILHIMLWLGNYTSTQKPKYFRGKIKRGQEEVLQGLKAWLLKGKEYYRCFGNDKGFAAWSLWIHYSTYEDLEQALSEIDDSLNGSFFVPTY